LHSYLAAMRRATGLDISAAVVVGWYKGYESRGKQNSPFCAAYHRPGNPPFTAGDIAYQWKAGYKKLPVWQIDGTSPESWVDQMPDDVLAEQFVIVPPVYLNEQIAETFFRQSRFREAEIQQGIQLLKQAPTEEFKQHVFDAYFPQNQEGCRPGW